MKFQKRSGWLFSFVFIALSFSQLSGMLDEYLPEDSPAMYNEEKLQGIIDSNSENIASFFLHYTLVSHLFFVLTCGRLEHLNTKNVFGVFAHCPQDEDYILFGDVRDSNNAEEKANDIVDKCIIDVLRNMLKFESKRKLKYRSYGHKEIFKFLFGYNIADKLFSYESESMQPIYKKLDYEKSFAILKEKLLSPITDYLHREFMEKGKQIIDENLLGPMLHCGSANEKKDHFLNFWAGYSFVEGVEADRDYYAKLYDLVVQGSYVIGFSPWGFDEKLKETLDKCSLGKLNTLILCRTAERFCKCCGHRID